MTFSINKRLLFFLVIAFIIATITGTVLHECGHYIAARMMGFDAHISYNMTWLTDEHKTMNVRQEFWFILAGPLQTMLTGTIGMLLLYCSSKPVGKMSFKKWFFIFISLFWLRQPANFIRWLTGYSITGNVREDGDEIKLTRFLNWQNWSVILITAFIGLLVLLLIIFKFIPQSKRLTFLVSGIIGGIAGFVLWLVYFGKVVMP